jgi:type I restriction enzyme, R subunit
LAAGATPIGPYRIGRRADFDAALALDTALFWEFLETTQGKELDKLKARNPGDWQRQDPRTLRPADQEATACCTC